MGNSRGSRDNDHFQQRGRQKVLTSRGGGVDGGGGGGGGDTAAAMHKSAVAL